ncbi:MAG: hypothetical protein HON07_04815 [Planctomycetaceae bacterium]|nr:hypothetical protein [Planctomycetaceae bacterium]
MEITNNFKLPEFVVDALTFSDYSRGDSQISVTQLIDSPRIVQLQKQFADEQKKDAVDFVWSRFGTSVHNMFEESLKAAESDAITEERLFTEWRGWTLSGAIDVQEIHDDGVTISDYKVTSVWSVINDKPSWHKQLNSYAYLVRKAKGQTVKKLQIVALLRDWSRRKAEQERNYPSAPVVVIDIPLWSNEEQDKYVDEQMDKHVGAEFDAATEQTLIACTGEEMWEKATVYAVMRKGRKSAIKLFPTEVDAEDRLASLDKTHYIETRAGEKTRCAGDWCGVSQWCDQYQAEVWGAK